MQFRNSCQKKSVEKIIKKKANYAIGLKQNQPDLYKDTEDYFNEFSVDISMKSTLDKGHGRIGKENIDCLLSRLGWSKKRVKGLERTWVCEVHSFRKS